MNHQPFKNWIVSDEILQPEQIMHLQAHLETCVSCRDLSTSWSEVRTILQTAQTVQPTFDFKERWQARLIEQNENLLYRKQRQSWWFFFITVVIAFLLFGLLLAQIITSFESPMAFFLSGLYVFTEAIASLTTLQGLVSTLMNILIVIVPPIWWIVLAFTICALITIWLISLRRVVYPRRVTQ
jgi:predicted anti-sigma-YlaC factor YlaD